MSETIRTEQLWKAYGRTQAVSGLSLAVPKGSVYGFLGPNGAGKSTTIRMVLGLQRPDRGSISLFGRPFEIAALRQIGSLVEAPSLYLHLTGAENLEVHRRLLALPKTAIGEALETVGLQDVGGRLARNYSSGMKQRLGIAIALLGSPELLVLDEPTNGLDPAGIHEVRALVGDLPARRGVTVFLSSHLLAEVEQVATHLAIISQGQVKFEGTREDLHQRSQPTLAIEVDQPERALAMIPGSTRQGNRILVTQGDPAQLNAMLVQAGIAVSHLAQQRMTLEDLFLELTQ